MKFINETNQHYILCNQFNKDTIYQYNLCQPKFDFKFTYPAIRHKLGSNGRDLSKIH